MTKVNVKDFSKSRPVLSPDMFPRADLVPFTVKTVEHVSFKQGTDEDAQNRIVLTSEEHGDNVLWLNVTGIKAMVSRLGDDDDNWIGKTIPLVKVRTTNPQTHEAVQVLWVAGANDDDAWTQVSGRRSPGRPKNPVLALTAKGKGGRKAK